MPNILVEEQLSTNRYLTSEGFLVCKNVCIARLGTQKYSKSELPTEDLEFVNNEVSVSRGKEDLFDALTLASFEGKTFTLEHPEDEVNADNWKDVAIGTVFNVRPDEENGLLIADIIVNDSTAIDLINSNKIRGISLGYECDYTQINAGNAKQTNIRGNHVSLVRYPRGGSVCTIKDSINNSKVVDFRLMTLLLNNV